MKLSLILTNDWELFGDGSGDYWEVQSKPTKELLSLLNSYNAKMSLMAEVMQQFHFLGGNNSQKEIASDWESICQDFISNKQDVQLHLHPQWLNAVERDGEIKLNESEWSIGQLNNKIAKDLLTKGKSYLESLLKPIDKDYSCSVFRAGAYYIEPSHHIVKSLKEIGINTDSSVTKGFKLKDHYNYENVPSNSIPWMVKDFVSDDSDEYHDFIEMPIYSIELFRSEVLEKFFPKLAYKIMFGQSPINKEIEWMNKRDLVKENRYPRSRRPYKKLEKKNISWFFSKFLSSQSLQLDYDYLPASIFVEIIKRVLSHFEKLSKGKLNISIPIIASGHIKDAHTNDNLAWILEGLKEYDSEIEYKTISEASQEWHALFSNNGK